MGNMHSGNGFSSPCLDTSPTSPLTDKRSSPMPRALRGIRGCSNSGNVSKILSRGSGRALMASWPTPATPLDIPLPYSSTEWQGDFEHRFEVKESLGSLGGRDLSLARDKETEELVLVEDIERRRESLLEEETFSRLDLELSVKQDLAASPAVATLKECHLGAETYSIVSTPCMGPSLRQQLQNSGPMSENEVAAVVYSVIEMLKLCRQCLVLHGSVTPDAFRLQYNAFNISKMVQRALLPIDFLKANDFTNSVYILNGGYLGDPCNKSEIPRGYRYSQRHPLPLYMAPEVFDHKYSYEADVWSLGIMTYELLSGRHPFWQSTQQALQMSNEGVKSKIMRCKPDLYSSNVRHLSTPCLDFLYQLLDKNRLSRLDIYKALEHPWISRRVKKLDSVEWGQGYILNSKLQ